MPPFLSLKSTFFQDLRVLKGLNSLKIPVHWGNSFVLVLMSLHCPFRDTHPRPTTLFHVHRTATLLIFGPHGSTCIFVMFLGSGWSSWFLSNQHIFPEYFPPKRKSVKLWALTWLIVEKISTHKVTYTWCKNLFNDWMNAGKSSQLGKHGFGSLRNLNWLCYRN